MGWTVTMELMMIHSIDDWQKYMQAALERGWPLAILVQTREKTQNEIQHGTDQAIPSIRRETNYVEKDESEEIENQNMGPQDLADEGERIHNIVDEGHVCAQQRAKRVRRPRGG